jgi:uncharacterized Zn finger protein
MTKEQYKIVNYKIVITCPVPCGGLPDSWHRIKIEDINTEIIVHCTTCGKAFKVFVKYLIHYRIILYVNHYPIKLPIITKEHQL